MKFFLRDRRGVSAVAFAITFAVLAPMTMGIFDVYQINEQRGKLQDALDAAALYAARSTATTTPEIDAIGDKALAANLKMIPGATLQSSDFTLDTTGSPKVVAQATVRVPALAPDAFTHNPLQVSSEVTRAGNNLEVALVLDITGSMSASIPSLQSAANQLIDLVVSDTQAPYYSKVAIVPYADSVNPGTYVTLARGAEVAGVGNDPTTGAGIPGYAQIKFNNSSGSSKTFNDSSCVSERTGAEAFTDASYTVAKVGWVYPPTSGNNACVTPTIMPLSSDKTALHTKVGTLSSNYSTAGQIGLAWGWYMVSPNWASLFPTGRGAVAYGTPHTLKAVVLMTDGAFNTAYCNGVISYQSSYQDGTSGTTSEHSNCASPNGDAFTQAQTLCAKMKAQPNNIIIYTVGFNVSSDPKATSLLSGCATDAKHVFYPSDGASLQVAFQQIGADLQRLRLSH
ncbi:MAG TPA: TadE/TadG family type IV pilus assembly protein [Phenylobacterium sp.]